MLEVDVSQKKIISAEVLEQLKRVKSKIEEEKLSIRQFLIETREKREKQEALSTPLTPSLSSCGDDSDSLAPKPRPQIHANEVVADDPSREIGSETPSEQFDEGTEGLNDRSADEIVGDTRDEEEDDFDMFNLSSPTPKKRKHVVNHAARKKIATAAAVLRAVDSYDDSEGYYKAELGEFLNGRYRVLSGLCGKGVFSSVIRCIDTEKSNDSPDTEVAIKIVRTNSLMRKAGEKEAAILRKLNTGDRENRKHIVHLNEVFDHRGHLCLVFEAMSLNLRNLLKTYGHGKGLNLQLVMIYGKQLMVALRHLKQTEIIHADIKPDNILANSDLNIVKICDLGSAMEVTENEVTDYLISRYYRAPEIIVGCQYSYPVDMWSMACTLYELAVGSILFTGRDNSNMLYQIMQLRGKVPKKVLRSGKTTFKHFSEDFSEFKLVEYEQRTKVSVVRPIVIPHNPTKSLLNLLTSKIPCPSESGPAQNAMRMKIKQFADFLGWGLSIDPSKRMTPEEALGHPFLKQSLSELTSSAS